MTRQIRFTYGFTLVEILVSVAIIGILASIVTLNFTTQQVNARDSTRSSKATIIAAALEKYYDEHGEYPSPKAILGTYGANTGPVVASLLSLADKDVLVMPNAPAGTTNSLASALGSTDVIAYVAASTVGNDNCQNNASAGCEQFTLSYKKESDGSTVTINSTYKLRPDDNTSPLDAPAKPTIAAVQSGTNLIATSSVPACSTDPVMSPSYSFRVQAGAGAWSSWSSWDQAGNPYTQGSNTNGTVYNFQVRVRCESATNTSDVSVASDSATVTYYTMPTAPTAPSVTIGLSGSNVITTITSAASCNYGTPQYRIDYRTNDGTWTTGSWGTGLTYSTAAADGVKYGSRVTAKCINGTQTATGSTGGEVTYVDPITTPGAPTSTATATYSTKTWTWSPSSCPSGTSPTYQYQFSYWNGTSWLPHTSWIATSSATATNAAATSQGIRYGINVNQQCYNSYTSSGWSTSPNSGSFWVPVVHVRVAYSALRLDSGAYASALIKTFTGTCASGLTRQVALKADWDNAGNWQFVTSMTTGTEGLVIQITTQTVPSGTMVEVSPRAQCINTATGYATDIDGQTSLDKAYDQGNLYNQGSSKYNISCAPNSTMPSYCAGGYSSGGTKNTTTSSTLSCNVKSSGISDTSIRYTAKFSFGTNNPCWNA